VSNSATQCVSIVCARCFVSSSRCSFSARCCVFCCSWRILVVLFCSCSHERFGKETKMGEKAMSWDRYKMEQTLGVLRTMNH